MNILIRNSDPRPIYEQVASQIKSAILSGEAAEGTLLPSIRNLAKDLRISVITTKRAYDELEKDGFIHTVAGKGCYVAPKNMDFIREQHLREMEELLRKVHALAKPVGISDEEVMELYTVLNEKEEEGSF